MLDAKGVVEPYTEPGQGRGWLILVLGLIVFAAFGGVVGYAYLYGMPGIGGEPPLIRAAAEPYRRAPSDRGGLEVANASSSIVSVLRPHTEQPRVERLLPPETGVALESGDDEPAADEAAATPPTKPGPVAPTGETIGAEAAPPAVTAPTPAPKPAQLAAREPPATISALPRPAPAVAPPPAAAPPAPAPVATPVPVQPRATVRVEPPAVAPSPAPAPTAVPPRAVAPPVAPGAGPQRLVRADPTVPPAAAAPRSGSSAGIYRLQLTAVRSESGLTKAWADLRDRFPTALASVSPQVERTQTSSGPLFRLQAGPFANRESAANACETIRSTGGQCFIVGPIAP